jgi:tetratricopeptide (TPR) repeat protein
MRHVISVVLALLLLAAPLAAVNAAASSAEDAAKIVAVSHLKKGMTLRDRGRLEAAEREFDLAIESYPDGANLYSARGEVRYLRKNYPAAISDFDAYLSRVPTDAKFFFLRGLSKSLLKPEDVGGACADILEAMRYGYSMDGIKGLDTYCKGQPGWHDT